MTAIIGTSTATYLSVTGVVTSNLVLYYDSTNTSSYPGTGTSVLDLSGNSKTGTLSNVAYSSVDKRFTFDALTSSISFSTTGLNFANAQTIILFLKPTENEPVNRRNPYAHEYAGYGTITHEISGFFNYYYGTAGGSAGGNYDALGSNFFVYKDEMAMIAITRSGTSLKWYKNGELFASKTALYATAVTTTSVATIGSGYAGPSFGGEINISMLYDRALTQAEIRQNFAVLKSRVGLI